MDRKNNINNLFDRWDKKSLMITNRYKLDKKAILLTLLFYQYSFIKRILGKKANNIKVLTSFLEENVNICMVIVSSNINDNKITLDRFVLDENIYIILKEISEKRCMDKDITIKIDNELVDIFRKLSTQFQI